MQAWGAWQVSALAVYGVIFRNLLSLCAGRSKF